MKHFIDTQTVAGVGMPAATDSVVIEIHALSMAEHRGGEAQAIGAAELT